MRIKKYSIYYADLDPAKGSEQCGIISVLVIQNDAGNKVSQRLSLQLSQAERRKCECRLVCQSFLKKDGFRKTRWQCWSRSELSTRNVSKIMLAESTSNLPVL